MSKQRREKSLYQRPLTPDFINPPEIKPDTAIERKLYKMLLNERQKNARLQFTIAKLHDEIRERNARRKIRRVSRGLRVSALNRPAQKGQNL